MKLIKYLLIGIFFGLVLTKAEVISWFRIQEMFRFQSFHMYGIIGSAVAVGMISVQIIKRFGLKSFSGETIEIKPKQYDKGLFIGGFIFGLGWAMTGACPGPLFALVGGGYPIMAVALFFALVGTFVYGVFRDKLPH